MTYFSLLNDTSINYGNDSAIIENTNSADLNFILRKSLKRN